MLDLVYTAARLFLNLLPFGAVFKRNVSMGLMSHLLKSLGGISVFINFLTGGTFLITFSQLQKNLH